MIFLFVGFALLLIFILYKVKASGCVSRYVFIHAAPLAMFYKYTYIICYIRTETYLFSFFSNKIHAVCRCLSWRVTPFACVYRNLESEGWGCVSVLV